MKAGSLCTGIGGLDLAAEAFFGCELAWYAEIEPAPCTVLEREWPGVPNLRDLTTVDWAEVEPVDVLTAGYPCQPFSHAGKRKGSEDERHLWPHIAEAVRVLRPRWVLLENVAGHLSLGFGDVLGDLAKAGFDAEWGLLRASDVGAPHQRARLFVVAANTKNVGHERPRLARGRRAGSADSGDAAPNPDGARLEGRRRPAPLDRVEQSPGEGGFEVEWGQYEPAIRRWEHVLGRPAPRPVDDRGRLAPAFVEWMMGYPAGWVADLSRTQALKALGNAVVPQQGYAALCELVPAHLEERAA